MPLLAHAISFSKPGGNFAINLIHVFEAKGVEMISGRKSFDAPEAWILEAAREDDVAIHPIPPDDKCREAHAHLKGDPRFLGARR
jgi:hypothetical protein